MASDNTCKKARSILSTKERRLNCAVTLVGGQPRFSRVNVNQHFCEYECLAQIRAVERRHDTFHAMTAVNKADVLKDVDFRFVAIKDEKSEWKRKRHFRRSKPSPYLLTVIFSDAEHAVNGC